METLDKSIQGRGTIFQRKGDLNCSAKKAQKIVLTLERMWLNLGCNRDCFSDSHVLIIHPHGIPRQCLDIYQGHPLHYCLPKIHNSITSLSCLINNEVERLYQPKTKQTQENIAGPISPAFSD
jgi:hypothetical protein